MHDSDHLIHPAFSRRYEDVAITGVGQRFPTCCQDAPRVGGLSDGQTSAGPKMLSATRHLHDADLRQDHHPQGAWRTWRYLEGSER